VRQFKNILVTGNLGYIGPVLVGRLKLLGAKVIGLDSGYYTATSLENMMKPDKQIVKDIRDVNATDLEHIDAIIHLAGLSNDPLGELNPNLTDDINFQATENLAVLAKKVGVHRFVFASSQSLYGIVDPSIEATEDNADIINPLTAYAKTKWRCENMLTELADEHFCPVIFRPATVFGYAPNLRVDIVYNSLVSSAFCTGEIEIKSDGTPWRPIIHVWDVCSAFILGLEAETELVFCEAFNVGILDQNFRISEMADAVQTLIPTTKVRYTGEHGGDQRSYRVSFDKIYERFDGKFSPAYDLLSGGADLLSNMMRVGFNERHFRGKACNRLASLKQYLSTNKMDNHLRWTD
jgi:nucleoside-diphosphate-sugar epimerase